MAKFCTKCGRPLTEGQVCVCQQSAPAQNTNPFGGGFNTPQTNEQQTFNQQGFTGGFNQDFNQGFAGNSNQANGADMNPYGATGFNPNFNEGFNTSAQPQQNMGYNPNGGFNTGRACPRCGRALVPGRACVCTQTRAKAQAPSVNLDSLMDVWAAIKNHMGIGDPESNNTDAYEKNKKIVPDVIEPNDKEIPVKQFQVAKLRNRLFGIPYMKAYGRVQVTNKRVIFRAPGKCIAGKTAISHEFAIDEIAGIESSKEFVFNIWDLLFGYFFAFIAGTLLVSFDTLILRESNSYLLTAFIALFFGVASCVPFALLKKKWWLKLMCAGGATMNLFTISAMASYFDYEWLGKIMVLFGWLTLAVTLISLFFHVIKPNLVLVIKTKAATQAIDISRKKES